jgi:hypothetical protein
MSLSDTSEMIEGTARLREMKARGMKGRPWRVDEKPTLRPSVAARKRAPPRRAPDQLLYAVTSCSNRSPSMNPTTCSGRSAGWTWTSFRSASETGLSCSTDWACPAPSSGSAPGQTEAMVTLEGTAMPARTWKLIEPELTCGALPACRTECCSVGRCCAVTFFPLWVWI